MYAESIIAIKTAIPLVAIDNFLPNVCPSQSRYDMQNRTRLGVIKSKENIVMET
jgi:hypothetical protein